MWQLELCSSQILQSQTVPEATPLVMFVWVGLAVLGRKAKVQKTLGLGRVEVEGKRYEGVRRAHAVGIGGRGRAIASGLVLRQHSMRH